MWSPPLSAQSRLMTNRHPHEGTPTSRTSLLRITTATVVTGIATLAFSAPANARLLPDPPAIGHQTTSTGSPPAPGSTGAVWGQIALGAGAGVVLSGAGAAALAGKRRRSAHAPHPA